MFSTGNFFTKKYKMDEWFTGQAILTDDAGSVYRKKGYPLQEKGGPAAKIADNIYCGVGDFSSCTGLISPIFM